MVDRENTCNNFINIYIIDYQYITISNYILTTFP